MGRGFEHFSKTDRWPEVYEKGVPSLIMTEVYIKPTMKYYLKLLFI